MKTKLPDFHAGDWRAELDASNRNLSLIPTPQRMTMWRFIEITHRLSDLLLVDVEALNLEAAQALILQWRPVVRDFVSDGIRERVKSAAPVVFAALLGAILGGGAVWLFGR